MNEEGKKIFCTQCGSENGEEAKFCSNCGAKLEKPAKDAEIPAYERVEGEAVSEEIFNDTPEIQIQYEPERKGNIGFAIASMICGILSLLCCCLSFVGLILSIAAIVLGIISLNGKYDGRGMAIAGIITGGLGALIFALTMLVGGVTGVFGDMAAELTR